MEGYTKLTSVEDFIRVFDGIKLDKCQLFRDVEEDTFQPRITVILNRDGVIEKWSYTLALAQDVKATGWKPAE